MQLSIVKEIFGQPWQISAHGIEQYYPVILGTLNGAVLVSETEPKENIPYAIEADRKLPLAWSDDEETGENQEEEPTKEKVIHVLPVRGVMMKHDMACGPRGTRTLGNRLRNADADPSVIGHIMIIEGPGGSANAVAELSEAIEDCKKPVVAWVDGLMCSAHMYAGSYAKEIIASRPTDMVGCIGTLLVYSGRKAKSEEDFFKVREVTIYADDAFEKNEEYEKAINEFDFKLAKENILNPFNKKFTDDIKKNRPGAEDKHLHGRTFPAGEVVGSLVDAIGPFEMAIDRVIALSNYHKQDKTAQSQSVDGAAAQHQSIKTDMKQFKNVNAALGVESLEAVDGAASLNEDQLQTLDTALGNESLAELQGQIETATATISERDETIAGLTSQVETATQTIAERDSTIEGLNAQIVSLKGEPATKPVVAKTKTDGELTKTEGKAISESYENPFDALDAVSEEYLGKPVNK